MAGNRGAGCKYDCMHIEDIKALPISTLADDNCMLFIWITMPMLKEAFEVIEAWGFEYKTNAFTWVKQNKKSDSLFWGMGNWTRANAEVCLMGIKGKPKRVDAGVHSVVITHVEEHSKKPDEVRNRIVRLLGDIPKIELFARQEVTGWDCWGDEC